MFILNIKGFHGNQSLLHKHLKLSKYINKILMRGCVCVCVYKTHTYLLPNLGYAILKFVIIHVILIDTNVC